MVAYQRALNPIAPAVFPLYQGDNGDAVAKLADAGKEFPDNEGLHFGFFSESKFKLILIAIVPIPNAKPAPPLFRFHLSPSNRVGVDQTSLFELWKLRMTREASFRDLSDGTHDRYERLKVFYGFSFRNNCFFF